MRRRHPIDGFPRAPPDQKLRQLIDRRELEQRVVRDRDAVHLGVDHVEAAFVRRHGLDPHLVHHANAVGAQGAQPAALDGDRRRGDPAAQIGAALAVAGVAARLEETERQRPRIEAAWRRAGIRAR